MTDYASHHATYGHVLTGRMKDLPSDGIRSEYERDVHRILYSDAFRRLRHKAQVYFVPSNDHICTRMEHVLHVAAAARTVARRIGLDDDLVHAIALGHDLGHAPFGHHGEDVLSKIATKHGINGGLFQHELHGLRVVDRLACLDREKEPGLNLTYAVRDGIISHCGEDPCKALSPANPAEKDLSAISEKKEASPPASFEGCVVKLADRIVYAGRDLEDALKAGIIQQDQIDRELKGTTELLGKNNGEIVGNLVTDLIENCESGTIALSENYAAELNRLIKWQYSNIYNEERVERYKAHTTQGMMALFQQLLSDIKSTNRFSERDRLPDAEVYTVFAKFIADCQYPDAERDEQIVFDFIAGMTDNYFIRCINDIFVPRPIT